MAVGELFAMVSVAAYQESCTLRSGFRDELLEAIKGCGRNGCADVDGFVLICFAAAIGVEVAPHSQCADTWLEQSDECRIRPRHGDDTFDAHAILSSGLKDSTHEDACDSGNLSTRHGLSIRVIENDCGVFAAQFDAQRNQGLGCALRDLVCDRSTANEGEVCDSTMRGEVVGSLWPAGDGVCDVGIMTTGCKRTSNDVDKVSGRPRSLLAALDDDRVTGKQRANDRAKQVMERITVDSISHERGV